VIAADARTDSLAPGSRRTPQSLDAQPRTAALRWFAGAFLLLLGMSFLILPRGPINPYYGLIWLRGPFFVLSGLTLLWLAVLPLSRRAALIAHGLAALPAIAVAAEYLDLKNYGPAITLLLLGFALALSPLAPPRAASKIFRPDVLGVALGLALGGQGLALLVSDPNVIPFGLQTTVGILDTVFGFGVALFHLILWLAARSLPSPVLHGIHLGAGFTNLAVYVILALGYGRALWVLNFSGLLVAAAFLSLPWLSAPITMFAPDSVRARLAGGLFDGALIPLLIAVPLVLATPGVAGTASTQTRQLAFGVAIALSILAGAAGWWLARVLVIPLSRLVHGVESIAAGVRPAGVLGDGPREVKELAAAVESMAGTLDEQMAALAEARDQHKAVAEKLQSALQVPLGKLPGLEVGIVYHSATELAELGGDFYDVFRTAAGQVGILIGDVSGRGLDAAAQAVLIRTSLRALIHSTGDPAESLTHANRQLVQSGGRGFVTAFVGLLDTVSGELLYSTAGHPPLVLLAGEHAALREAGSPVLGVFENVLFRDAGLRLRAEDMLLLYTDGLTEARRDGDLFGEQRLLSKVEEWRAMTPADLARGLYAAAVEHAGGVLADDLAVLALRLLPAEAEASPAA
jgi:serine phosphatase RsbU (regulator of sigma subunit)